MSTIDSNGKRFFVGDKVKWTENKKSYTGKITKIVDKNKVEIQRDFYNNLRVLPIKKLQING